MIEETKNILSPELQYGAFAIVVIVLAILFFVIKKLLKMIGNDLHDIGEKLNGVQKTLDGLPCVDAECPRGGAESDG